MNAWWILLLVLFAGCQDAPQSLPPGTDPGVVDATATTGGIRGVVVDQSIRPVAGADVAILNGPHETVTKSDGTFIFSGLVPGDYFVRASHPLYNTAQGSATVVAGVADPPVVRLQLERLITTDPYFVTIKEQGYISCSANVVGAKSEECGEGVGVPGQGRVGNQTNNRAQIDFWLQGPAARTVIVEQVWDASTEASGGDSAGQFDTRVATDWSCDPSCSGNVLNSTTGPSPIYLAIHAPKLAALNITPELTFSTFTWAEDNPGVLIEQEFELFVTTFYFLPAPPGWSYVGGSPDPF